MDFFADMGQQQPAHPALASLPLGAWWRFVVKLCIALMLPVCTAVNAERYPLPAPKGHTLAIDSLVALTPAGHAALAQLQAELPAQWALLEDATYWPLAQQYAATKQWPATAGLLRQALQHCEAWWQQQQSYHCRFGQARLQWQTLLTDNTTTAVPDRVLSRRYARQVLAPNAEFLPDLQDFAVAVLLDNIWQRSQQIWPAASAVHLQFDNWHAARGEPKQLQASEPLQQVALKDAMLLHFDNSHQPITAIGRYARLWLPTEAWPATLAPDVHVIAASFEQAWLHAHAIAAASPTQRQHYTAQVAALWQFTGFTDLTAAPIQQASQAWYPYVQDAHLQQADSLVLSIELPPQPSGSKRPYVSAWISNTRGWQQQLLLIGEQTRWYSELRSWWRALKTTLDHTGGSHQITALSQLTDQWAGATRKSGVQQVVWQARQRNGHPLPAGEYHINIEAAREGGGRELLRMTLHWPLPLQQTLQLQGHHELGRVTLTRQ